jgi:hypothetical protein
MLHALEVLPWKYKVLSITVSLCRTIRPPWLKERECALASLTPINRRRLVSDSLNSKGR